jgi:ligand-binding SRPBCC domain-containing protein
VSKIVMEAWLPVPIGMVFTFFSDPNNLPRLMPAQLAAKIVDMQIVPPDSESVVQSGEKSTCSAPAGPGSLITVSFRVVPFLPFRSQWIAKIVEFDPGSYFRDIQEKGPMKSWSHTHQFRSVTRDGIPGTVVGDIVDYQLPFGLLGSLADWLFVRALMRLTFRSRQKTLAQLLS